jgi:hypothetical protein
MVLTDEERSALLTEIRKELEKYERYDTPAVREAIDDDSIVNEAQSRVLNRASAALERLRRSHEPQRSALEEFRRRSP